MKLKKILMQSANLFILLTFMCCSTTREITRRSELNPFEIGTITVETSKGRIFELPKYRLDKDTLFGVGTLITDSTDVPFKGTIALSEIKYISSSEISWDKTLWAVAGVTTFSIMLIHQFGADNGMTNEIHIIYPSGGGCGVAHNFEGNSVYDLCAGGLPGISEMDYRTVDIKGKNSFTRFQLTSDENGVTLKSIPAIQDNPDGGTIIIDLSGDIGVITFE